MKNIKAIIAAAAAATACAAMADVLHWQVSDAKFKATGNPANFEYATVRNGTGAEAPAEGSKVGEASQYYMLYTVDAANNAAATSQYRFYSDPSDANSTRGGAQAFGDIGSDVTDLIFELWNGNGTLVGYASMGRGIWSSYLDSLDGLNSSYSGGALQVSDIVPEPTSGLLLLLGAGVLALRRRRLRALAALAAMLCAPTYAAQNDALLTFSTKGPDRYADGTRVMDGERYALVWTPKDSKGARIAADGTVDGGEIVLVAPVAKGGRCPRTVFQIDASLVAKRYAGGTWGVYLLDTRSWGADGVAKVSGTMKCVNAAGLASGQTVSVGAGGAASASAGEAVAGAATAVPAALQGAKPRITAIRVEGGNVFVTAKGTFPCLQYDLLSGDGPGAVSASANSPRGGAASPEEEVVFVAPAKKGASFFKIGRK